MPDPRHPAIMASVADAATLGEARGVVVRESDIMVASGDRFSIYSVAGNAK